MAINQFQMTGDVHVIVRAIGNVAINGTDYIANEVIASFTGDVSVNFGSTQSVARTDTTQLARNDVYADTLSIIPKILNDGVYNLISKRIAGDVLVPVIVTKTSNASGAIYLNSEVSNTSFIIKNTTGTILSGYSVDATTGTITGLSANTEHKLYYYEVKTPLTSVTFEGAILPYVKMELVGKGNVNNETKSFLIEIPKVQINGSPQLNFDNSSIINIILNCNIINLDIVKMYYY